MVLSYIYKSLQKQTKLKEMDSNTVLEHETITRAVTGGIIIDSGFCQDSL